MARASDTAPVHGFGWKLMVLLIVLVGATGLTALLIGRMQSVSQATDLQAFQRLAITAQSFAAWPRVAADIGQRSVPLRRDRVPGKAAAALSGDPVHPQFGRLPLRYDRGGASECDGGPRLALGPTGMTVSGRTIRFGNARDDAVAAAVDETALGGGPQTGDRICFAIGPLPYRHTLPVPEGFQALLLFEDQATAAAGRENPRSAAGGRLVAQVGADVLPIRDTADIPDLQRLLHRAAIDQKPATATDPAGVISAIGTTLSRRDSAYLAPVDTAIAGRPYRLYVYPVTIRLGQIEQRMLVVGAMLPHPTLFDVNLNGSRIAAIGLLLLAFLTLTPFLRLDNLGAMDGVRQSDVMLMGGALLMGFAIAATIATLAVTSVTARRSADAALARNAAGLAGAIGGEIAALGDCRQPGALAAAVNGAALPVRPASDDDGSRDGCRVDGIAWPDVTIFVDADGQQAFADGRFVPIIGYSARPGALFDVGDRSYFVRARDRDVVPRTARLAERIARGLASCDRIPCRDPLSRALYPTTGITIEQVLSRADGIARTLLALPLTPDDKDALLARARAKAVAMGFVMRSMLAPAVPSGMRYAVIDLSHRPELPAIFHSDPERANAERFALTLSAPTLARFLNATRLPRRACGGAGPTLATAAFSGRYIGEDQRFATALVPCTEWAVVTFTADARIDARGIYPAEVGLAAWMGFALVLVAVLGLAVVAIRRLTRLRFGMFWPDALQTETYRRIAIGLASAIAAALAARFVFGLAGGWALLLAPIACGAAVAYLLRQVLGRDGETPREAWLRHTPYLPVMNRRTERFYLLALALWLAMAGAVPVLLIAADADAHNRARIVAADHDAAVAARQAKARALALIGASQRGIVAGRELPADAGRGGAPPTPPAVRNGNVAALLFCLLDRGPCGRPPIAAAGGASAAAPGAGAAGMRPHGVVFAMAWGSIVILALLLPAAMLRLFSRTLLGFGVPLEPVRYPRIRPGQDRAWTVSNAPGDAETWAAGYPGSAVSAADGPAFPDLPESGEEERTVIRVHAAEWPDAAALVARLRLLRKRQAAGRPGEAGFRILLVLPEPPTAGALDGELVHYHVENEPPYDEQSAPRLAMLVGGADELRRRLRDYARPHTIDLYEIARKAPDEPLAPEAIDALLPAIPPPGAARPLVIAENLELLIRDDKGRGRALALLEELVRRQGPNTHRPGSPPAFRLLLLADISPLDRFLQASEWRDEETDAEATGGLDDPAERIRWSRLLENFTTYTGRVTPRQRTYQPGDTDIGPSLRFLLAEVAYLPDPVVRALLPDTDDTLLERDIVVWGQFLKDTSPAAIADFLASQLIEHYHYLWSISSRAEQILMHRMAAGELPVTRRAYALRSLVRRGIVVLDPAPRLMSYSFARFVRTVERPELLRRWIRQAPQGGWTRIHGNLTIVLPLVLLLGGVLIVQGLVGIEAVVPLIAAAASALLRPLLSTSQPAG